MLVKGKIKRKPGRPWGSFTKKLDSGSRSWTPSNRKPVPKGTGRPPGRPWHTNASRKACLLCLKQYNEELMISSEEEEDEDEPGEVQTVGPDPLSDDDGVLTVDVVRSSPKKCRLPKVTRTGLYLKFLKFLARHLRVKTKRFRNSAQKNELPAPFCENCTVLVKKLCLVYEEWHKTKLGLQWRLGQVKEAIKNSKERCKGPGEVAVLKSLSSQLRVFSSQFVGLLRKQISIQCTAKLNTSLFPKVSVDRNSCLKAVKANWKWRFSFDQVRHYLQSLIVVFVLAAPPKVPPPAPPPKRKPLPLAGPKSKTRKVLLSDLTFMVKREGSESKKENVPPKSQKLKKEPGQENEECNNDDDHFSGGGYSPPGSGPTSPAGGDNDEMDGHEEQNKNGHDSDWSAGAANDSAGSDVEFTVSANTSRRWNLRRRKTRSKPGGDDKGQDSDEEYVPDALPPLRRPRGFRSGEEVEKPHACNLCNMKFTLERGLKRHLSQVHAFIMQYNCPHCPNLRFRQFKELYQHKKKFHLGVNSTTGVAYLGVSTKCTVCDLVFPSKIKMQRHRKTTHKLMTTVYTCETCGKNIQGLSRFNLHKAAHNRPDRPYRCMKCPRGFGTEEGLKAHEKLHEQNPDWKPFFRVKKRKGEAVEVLREGTYICDEPNCGKKFHKSSNLIIHKSLHTEDFKCDVCSAKFTITRDFRRHLVMKHETEEKKFFCCHCDKSFTMEQTFILHRKIAHPTKATITCDIDDCQEEFEHTEQLRQHLKTMHLPPDVEESKENVKFSEVYKKKDIKPIAGEETTEAPPENAFADLLVIPPKETGEVVPEPPRLYTCSRCDWSFGSKISYSLHLIVHTPRNEKRMYPCELCDKSFGIVDTLQTHYNRIHGPRIKPYCCLICGTRFHRKESFIPHMRIHQDKDSSKQFPCDSCDKVYYDSVNLAKHRRFHHNVVKVSRPCDLCTETFPTKTALMMHKFEVHGSEKPFLCPAEGCDKGFFTQGQLKDHKISHGEAIYQCPMCPKKFKRRHNLDDHILVHKQIKNHFCEYCGRAFVKKSSLNLHLDIHRGIKKYKCDHCGKEFCRKFARDCHLRIHTKERPFKCDICPRDFAQYSSLTSHLKSHKALNSDRIQRRPFRKTVGVGNPIMLDNDGEAEDTKVHAEASYSGILSNAMKASMLGEMDAAPDQKPVSAGTSMEGVINEQAASNAVEALQETKEEDDSDDEEEEEEAPVAKRKRKPKTRKKEYSCGFCGKLFYREDFFNKHVNKHMTEDSGPPSSLAGESSQMSLPMDDHTSLQEVLQPGPQHHEQSFQLPLLTPAPVQQTPPHYTPPPPPPQAPRKRGRPRLHNSTPGSRLAQIVEDVLETAQNRPRPGNSQQQTTGQHQYQQQSPMHPSPQMIQSPHSGSERSTPDGSPAPIYSQQAVTTSTASAPTLSFPSSSVASFLSPFLYNNPYIIPRPSDQQPSGQQDPMLSGFPARPQSFSQPPAVNYPQQQFHQLPIQTNVSSQQVAARTLPQDLSKANYNVFYNNSQR